MSLESELKEESKNNKKTRTKEAVKSTTNKSNFNDIESKKRKVVNVKNSNSKKNNVKISNGEILSQGVGRRKSSVARVYLKEGEGNFIVNNVDYKVFSEMNSYIINYLNHLKSSTV
jgi:hypothetical protein